MPRESMHNTQISHNLDLLDSIPETHNDWKVTVIFYVAFHLIEKFLATKNIHTTNHSQRFGYVRVISELKRIACEYQTLYMSSIKSRYDCQSFKNEDVETLKSLLKKIEKEMPV